MLQTHVTEHTVSVGAPADAVFALIADVTRWPQMFGPTVHVEVHEEDGPLQLLRIWAFAAGNVRTWVSQRTLDARAKLITFQQVVSVAPVAAMGGEWLVRPAGPDRSTVVLTHRFQAVDDDPEAVRLINAATDNNSTAELAALARFAEGAADEELRFTFSDTERIRGQAKDVFEFLHEAGRWPERLPHVARLELTESRPDEGPRKVGGGTEETVHQHMEMDTRSPDGSVHTTTSVRLSFPERGTIIYKQLRVPPVLAAHTGRWDVTSNGREVTATSWHTVALDPAGVREALGPQGTLAEARKLVRAALGGNSSTTLRHAREYAEARAPLALGG